MANLVVVVALLHAPAAHAQEGADVVKKYLAGDTALLDPSVVGASDGLAAEACGERPVLDVAAARIYPSAAGNGRFVVDYEPGKGRGAHRDLYVVTGKGAGARIVDLSALVHAANRALDDGDLAGAATLAERALTIDAGDAEALAVLARAAVRLSDVARAEQALKTAREQSPESSAWRFAAYDVAVLARKTETERDAARNECMQLVRSERLDDGRCFFAHAMEQRGKDNQVILRQEIEEALGRDPDDEALKLAQGLLTHTLATTGRSVDTALLAQSQMQLKAGLQCPESVESPHRAAAYHALASTTLILGNGVCASDAEHAVLSDPSVAEYRRTLLSCAEATVLTANRMNRHAMREGAVDLEIEGRAITSALMRDKVVVGGRTLPAYRAFSRARARIQQRGDRVDVALLDLPKPAKRSRQEETVAAAFMVHTVYQALYGIDAPLLSTVRVEFEGDGKAYVFPMPDTLKPDWSARLPASADLTQMARHVVVRPTE